MRIAFFSAAVPAAAAAAGMLAAQHQLTFLHPEELAFEFACPDRRVPSPQALDRCGLDECGLVIYYAAAGLSEAWLSAICDRFSVPVMCVQERPVCPETAPRITQAEAVTLLARTKLGRRAAYVSVPAVYGEDYLPDELMTPLIRRSARNRVVLRGSEDGSCELLRDADLASLLAVLCARPELPERLTITGGSMVTMKELAHTLRESLRLTEIAYDRPAAGDRSLTYDPVPEWAPAHQPLPELPALLDSAELIGRHEAALRRGKRLSFAGKLAVFASLFALVTLYTGFIRVSSELQFVDVRLLFVVGISLFFGRGFGLAAGVCAGVSSVASAILSGTAWQVIFFHIDNWIPVAVYLASAVLFGMVHENRQQTADSEVAS